MRIEPSRELPAAAPDPLAPARDAVARAFPGTDPLALRPVASSSNIVLREGATLFRVARQPALADPHRRAAALLGCLATGLPWRLPRVLGWVDLPPSVLRLEWIEGATAAWLEPRLRAAPADHQAVLGDLLGSGLAALHGLDLPGLPAWEDLPWHALLLRDRARNLAAAGDPRGDLVLRACEDWPLEPADRADLRPGHGDFLPPNILLAEDSLALAGVIDLDRLGLHEPAVDLAGLLQLPPAVAQAGLRAYRAAGGCLPPPRRLRALAVYFAARALLMAAAPPPAAAERLCLLLEAELELPPG